MDTFSIFKVSGGSDTVELQATDPAELEWLVSELKKIFPKARVNRERKLPTSGDKFALFETPTLLGETYDIMMDKLSDRGISASWWVIKQLCARGWEPFGSISYVYGSGTGITTSPEYLFRRKVAQGRKN